MFVSIFNRLHILYMKICIKTLRTRKIHTNRTNKSCWNRAECKKIITISACQRISEHVAVHMPWLFPRSTIVLRVKPSSSERSSETIFCCATASRHASSAWSREAFSRSAIPLPNLNMRRERERERESVTDSDRQRETVIVTETDLKNDKEWNCKKQSKQKHTYDTIMAFQKYFSYSLSRKT